MKRPSAPTKERDAPAPADMPREERTVPHDAGSVRLDAFLAGFSSVGTRSRAQRAIRTGKVSVDGRAVGPDSSGAALAGGTCVAVEWNRPGTSAARSRALEHFHDTELRILYEDAALLAVDKPAGILTDAATRQQGRERATVSQLARAYLQPQRKSGIVVHRIDRDTSGVVLLAKARDAALDLQRQFRHGEPVRLYWAAVQGGPPEDSGIWEDMLVWDAKLLVQRVAHPRERGAKLARARWRVLGRSPSGDAAALEVSLETGRRNQIRLQCQRRGYPLVGERLYLDAGWVPRGPTLSRQALHAWSLEVRHPSTGNPIRVLSPLAAELRALAALVRTPRGAIPGLDDPP